jgi:hypothetical protein
MSCRKSVSPGDTPRAASQVEYRKEKKRKEKRREEKHERTKTCYADTMITRRASMLMLTYSAELHYPAIIPETP